MTTLTHFQRFAWDVGGILLLALALMSLLAILLPEAASGVLLGWWAGFLATWFGWGAVWVVLAIAAGGLVLLRRSSANPAVLRWGRVIAFEVAAFCSLGLLAAIGGTSIERADAGLDGGRVGWSLSYVLGLLLEPLGMDATGWQALIWGGLFIVFMALALGFVGWLLAWSARTLAAAGAPETASAGLEPMLSLSPVQSGGTSSVLDMGGKKKRVPLPAEFRKKLHLQEEVEEPVESAPPPPRDDRLPPLDLLVTEQVQRPDERNINLTAGLIEKTLAEFGIPAKVVGFRVGPTVTQFAVEPGFHGESRRQRWRATPAKQKVRVAQIAALQPRPGAGALCRTPAHRSAGARAPLRRHRSAQRPLHRRAPAPDPGDRRLSTRSARRWRLPWGGMFPGSRWSPTWRACRTC